MNVNDESYFVRLGELAQHVGVLDVWNEFIKRYPEFQFWSGSHHKWLHHYGKYGLSRHTCEVIQIGLNIVSQLHMEDKVDRIEYFLAALFHDTGKIYDYDHLTSDYSEWKPTEHRRLIHHLPRSAIIWHDVILKFPELYKKYHDSVLHAILAHHGQREHGSPVAPKTHVAWLLHLCDGISARMDDCDKHDVVKKDTLFQ